MPSVGSLACHLGGGSLADLQKGLDRWLVGNYKPTMVADFSEPPEGLPWEVWALFTTFLVLFVLAQIGGAI